MTGYKMMWTDMGQAARILFAMRSDNPRLLKPLGGIRRVLLAFVLFPIVFTVMLVFIMALAANTGNL